MYKYGLKLWSINENYISEAIRLHELGIYHYIELYVKPGSTDQYLELWQRLNIPYVIHAPHFRDGLNLAKKEKEMSNKKLFEEAQRFADKLSADKIIVHPGINGDIKETARQLKEINETRILVENKPYYALDDGLICNGTTPDEIKFITGEAGAGFCLDIGHAICSANAHNQDWLDYLKRFIKLSPRVYHVSDGNKDGVLDQHLHFGEGNFDFHNILSLFSLDASISIETEKRYKDSLSDFLDDINFIKETISGN